MKNICFKLLLSLILLMSSKEGITGKYNGPRDEVMATASVLNVFSITQAKLYNSEKVIWNFEKDHKYIIELSIVDIQYSLQDQTRDMNIPAVLYAGSMSRYNVNSVVKIGIKKSALWNNWKNPGKTKQTSIIGSSYLLRFL